MINKPFSKWCLQPQLQWPALLVVALVQSLIHLPQETQALSWVSPSPKGVFHSEQFSVMHSQLGGMIQLKNGSSVPATVLVYIKALQTEKGVQIRGHGWFLDANAVTLDRLYGTTKLLHVSIADFMVNITSHPEFVLRPHDTDSREQFQLSIIKPETISDHHELVDDEHMVYKFLSNTYTSRLPYIFETFLPGISVDTENVNTKMLKICINEWPQCAPVSVRKLLLDGQEIHQQFAQPSPAYIITVLKPMYGILPSVLAELLYYHTEFHVRLGVNATLSYDRIDLADVLLQHADIKTLVDNGRLMFMKWTHNHGGTTVPRFQSWWKYYDQQIVYSHAALSFWGLNTYLYYVDLDEFLHLPMGETLRSQMELGGCIHDKVYLQYRRVNYNCQQGGISTAAGHDLKYMPLLSCNRTTTWEWFDWPKCLALADSIATFFVHDGFLFAGYKDRAELVKDTCGVVIHLQNLASGHEFPERYADSVKIDDSWMWPLYDMVKDQDNGLQAPPKDIRPLREISVNVDSAF